MKKLLEKIFGLIKTMWQFFSSDSMRNIALVVIAVFLGIICFHKPQQRDTQRVYVVNTIDSNIINRELDVNVTNSELDTKITNTGLNVNAAITNSSLDVNVDNSTLNVNVEEVNGSYVTDGIPVKMVKETTYTPIFPISKRNPNLPSINSYE